MCGELEKFGSALLRETGNGQWLFFSFPLTELVANRDEDVVRVLEEVERATKRGRYAVGFLAYEAACALESALRTRKAGAGPLAWFGLYAEPRTVHLPPAGETSQRTLPDWTPDVAVARQGYRDAVSSRVSGRSSKPQALERDARRQIQARLGTCDFVFDLPPRAGIFAAVHIIVFCPFCFMTQGPESPLDEKAAVKLVAC